MLALINLSINRFLLSALSVSLPRVVSARLLLAANSLTPTLAAAAAIACAASCRWNRRSPGVVASPAPALLSRLDINPNGQ